MADFLASRKSDKRFEGALSTKALDYAVYSIIAAIFFLCPIFFTGFVAQGVGFEKMALFYFLVLLGAVVWIAKGVFKGELDIKRTPLDLPILGVNLIFAASTAFSISHKDSLLGAYGNPAKGMAAVLIFSLFYYLVINNIDTKRAKLYFFSFVASMILLALYSFLQINEKFIIPLDFAKSINFNPIGSLSGLTMALALVLPLISVAAAQINSIFPKLEKGPSIALQAVMVFGLVMVLVVLAMLNVFTFWLAIMAASVIVLVFFMAKIMPISTGNLLIPLGVFIVSIVFFMMGNISLFERNLPTEISLSRGASWDIALASLKENPFLGSGPSTFYYGFSKFKAAAFNSTPLWNVRFDSASGMIFELMASVGALGTLSIIVLSLIVFSLAFLALIKTKDKELNPLMLGLFSSFVTLLVLASLFAQNNSLIIVNILLGVLTFATAITIYPEKFQSINLSFRAAPKYALALAAISLSVFAGVIILFTVGLKIYLADVHARKAMLTDDPAAKVASLNKSITLAPYQDKYFLTLANSYIALANQAVVDNKDANEINQLLSQSIDNGKRSVELAPDSASNIEALALIYENASFYTRNALEWAEQNYNKLTEIEPVNPTPYMRLALVNMARSNQETDEEEKKYFVNQAISFYDKSLERKSDLAAAHYGKAVAYEKITDIDKSIEEMKQVNLLAGNNIDYRFELGRLLFNRGVASAPLKQTASNQIAANEINTTDGSDPSAAVPPKELSVTPAGQTGATIEKNQDLTDAEQIFLSILLAQENHANALYSLAVLYKKVGDTESMKNAFNKLITVVEDQATKDALKQQFPEIK